jgi:hypothetical protein
MSPEPTPTPVPEDHPAATAPVQPAPVREAAPAVDPGEMDRIRQERDQYVRDRELWMAERDQTRRWQQQVEARLPPPPQPAQPDLQRIWYENPELAAQIVEERAAQRVEARYRQDQEQQRRENIMKEFVGGMYAAHPELQGEDNLVAYVLQRDGAQIGQLRIPEGREALAKGVRDEIFRMERRAGEMKTREEGTAPPPAHRATVEGGSASRPATRREPEEAGAKSLTELIRQRREARDSARHGGQRRAG